MRVDENTKEVLKTWPLITVHSWTASPNSFTLVNGHHYMNRLGKGSAQLAGKGSPLVQIRLVAVVSRIGDFLMADKGS